MKKMTDRKFLLLEPSKPKSPVNNCGKTVRLTIDLSSNKNGKCPIFSYEELLRKATSSSNGHSGGRGKGGSDDDDEEDEMKRVANQLEEKYGKQTKKYQSYAELGAGYDESDSFIDNTDVCDEGLPDDIDTKKGGFYVNYGKLEFTKIYDQDNRDKPK